MVPFMKMFLRMLARNPQNHVDPGSQGQAGSMAAQGSADAAGSSTSTPITSSSAYLGIGVGVGGAILIAIMAVGVQILRKRAQHRRAVTELEDQSEHITVAGAMQEIGEVPRPVSVTRCGPLHPLHAQAGWGALSSNETVHESEPITRRGGKKRNSISLPRRIREKTIPLKRLKHLSAIIESPRSRTVTSPAHTKTLNKTTTPAKSARTSTSTRKKTILMIAAEDDDEDVFVMPGSPKPHVLPSFAIRSPGMYGAAIANDDDRPRPSRSISVGALQIPLYVAADSLTLDRSSRPQMHTRSISLGGPQSRPPSGPVPPLPASVPPNLPRKSSDDTNRCGVCVSRMSSSSQESASSSVLVISPILKVHENDRAISSPTVEQVIADDDSAQLKTVTNRQWQNPLITGPRPMEIPRVYEDTTAGARERSHHHNASIHSNIARYSTLSYRQSSPSTISSLDNDDALITNRLSIPRIATADRVSISRVSSYNSLSPSASCSAPATSSHVAAHGAVQKITTPRKPVRTSGSSVSANGSPAEKRKPPVLRDISGNANTGLTPSRRTSNSTSHSARSSNGNPFQWDQSLPLLKPSALKGSPNSKGSRGHKRQNCVRISTLTPTILGPPVLSRSTSPSFMQGIDEEEEDGEHVAPDGEGQGTRTRSRALPRLSSGNSLLAPRLQATTSTMLYQTSLTPSSPTLSMWTAYQEQQQSTGMAEIDLVEMQPSDSHFPASPLSAKDRSASRLSVQSSVSGLSIPIFPPPSRATVGGLHLQETVPVFCLSRPSTDDEEQEESDVAQSSSPPRLLHASFDEPHGQESPVIPEKSEYFPSSPPLPVSKDEEYDPAWRGLLLIPKPAPEADMLGNGKGVEYDPTSPLWPPTVMDSDPTAEHSSPAFPFTTTASNNTMGGAEEDEHVSPHSRPTTYGGDLPDTPPCSPKSRPVDTTTHVSDSTLLAQLSPPRVRPARLTAAEKLTSANASVIMATIPESPPIIGFPTAVPILAPPSEDTAQATIPLPRRGRAASHTSCLRPLRPAPPPPPILGLDTTTPQPLHIRNPSNLSPQGPRSEPAKSVLKSATALRRMNSEIDVETRGAMNRASRQYVRMGREASPLLPWIGATKVGAEPGFGGGVVGDERMADLFDFDFGSSMSAGAERELNGKSALDDVDFEALGSRLDGALSGFDTVGLVASSSSPPMDFKDVDYGSGVEITYQSRSGRSGSVWEDGELFWTKRPRFSFTPSSPPLDVNVTPMKKLYSGRAAAWEREGSRTPTQQMDILLGLDRPSSIVKTPKSLYDSDGFLKT
ncbi:hypothetical protein LTR78_000086 [Recurvomyces mirabilis]|uniref:Uncharacterized protein n=1 Tax=Recurvomyces mirabilis TaxID=574656 RepID=A0AAE0WWK4_9PEZI|nr:hypothetical protein LTR78_000086 [Recurvomyces mirabilis]KAK5161743.1 hypothetical protein LTS14_000088 [Recurvomyces mirabilis]